jgi:hypothetical protein
MKAIGKLAPALVKGQLWQTRETYIQIWHIGTRLMEYKMLKRLGVKGIRTQTTTIETLVKYLKAHQAVLVDAAAT